MNKLLLIVTLLNLVVVAYAQQDFMAFKKNDETIALYRKDAYITFQLKSRQWYTGYISTVQHDTFYVNPIFVHYTMMGPDTIHYPMMMVPFTDVYAMPRKGEQTSFANERVGVTFGHEHWVWLKNGLLLQVAGAGYLALYVANGLIKNAHTFSVANLSIGAGVFLIGELLHLSYHPTLRIGKKYHLESIRISG